MTPASGRFRIHAFALLAVAALSAGIFLYFLNLSGVGLIPHSSYDLHATVPDAIALADNADVTEAGVVVGRVDSVTIVGDDADVTLSLQPRYAPVYRDGQALIGDKSLLGENYVELDPGTPSAGAIRSGGTLPGIQPESTQLDQILSTLNGSRRRDVANILDDLNAGLAGHGADLNTFVAGATDLVDDAAPVTTVLATDRSQLAGLVDDLGFVTRALGNRAGDLQTLVRSAQVASAAVSARNVELRHALALLPGFLVQARETVTHLGTFSTNATPVIENLGVAANALVPAVVELRPAASATEQAVAELGTFATVAKPVAVALHPFAQEATTLLGPLETVLRQLNPAVAYLSPYASTLGSVFANARAVTNYSDATSHYGRVLADIQQETLTAGFLNPSLAAALEALLRAGLLGEVGTVHSNPYPKPGGNVHPTPWSGSYPRITEDPPYTLGSH